MVFNKLKSTAKERGFTIVELLIVIVVIAILAAITIVAYNGVQQKAKTTQAQTNAVQAQKVAEAYNADNSVYPATITNFTGGTTAKLPTSITMLKGGGVAGTSYATVALAATATTTAALLTSANGQTNVAFLLSGTVATPTGGVIFYWDYSTGLMSTNYVYFGAATSASTFYAPAP